MLTEGADAHDAHLSRRERRDRRRRRCGPTSSSSTRGLHLTGHVVSGPDRDDGWRALFARAAHLGLHVSVDPGSTGLLAEYGPERFRRLVAGCDLLLPGRDEAELLSGESDPMRAAKALAADHATVVVKCGPDGAVAVSEGRELVAPRPPRHRST